MAAESSCSSLFSGLRDKFRMSDVLSLPVQTEMANSNQIFTANGRLSSTFYYLETIAQCKRPRFIDGKRHEQDACVRNAIVVPVELPNKNLFDCDFWVISMPAVSLPQFPRFYWLLICEKNKWFV